MGKTKCHKMYRPFVLLLSPLFLEERKREGQWPKIVPKIGSKGHCVVCTYSERPSYYLETYYTYIAPLIHIQYIIWRKQYRNLSLSPILRLQFKLFFFVFSGNVSWNQTPSSVITPPSHILFLDWYYKKGRKFRRHEHIAPGDPRERRSRSKL